MTDLAEAGFDTRYAERLPPHDLLAEQSAIGGMLLSKDAVADCAEIIRSHDFYVPKHAIIFDAITTLYSRGEPVDVIAISDELTKTALLARAGGTDYLHSLTSIVPTAANAGYYAEIVVEKAVLRRLVEAGTRIAQMGYASEGEVNELVNHAQAEIYGVMGDNQHEDYVPLSDALAAAMDEFEAARGLDGTMLGVPTGITRFDELTNGLHPGQLVIIAARPGLGKSTFALDIARSAAIHHDLTSVFFSLEMSHTEIATKLLSAESNIFMGKLKKGDLEHQEWTKLASVSGRLNQAPLFIDDSPNLTLMEIRAKCRRLKQQHDLKLVVIDYLQLMTSGKRVESRQQEVSEFSRSLKLLAKELQVPVIALSQLNRNSEGRTDKRPQISDLRESGSIEQDADMVILIHRESMHNDEANKGAAELILAKHRGGPTDTINVTFSGALSRFANMAEEHRGDSYGSSGPGGYGPPEAPPPAEFDGGGFGEVPPPQL